MTIHNFFEGIAKHINPLPKWGSGGAIGAGRGILCILLLLCLLPCSATSSDGKYLNNLEGGTVLNCFGWRYSTITAQLDNIKKANFTAVQVSSVQPLAPKSAILGKYFNDPDNSPIPDWYRIYMPTALRMISASDAAGTNPLGSRADFDALITAAHAKNIAVMVGVEANQVVATGFDDSEFTNASTMLRAEYDPSHWTLVNNPFVDPTRKKFTQYSINAAVRDINTENKSVLTLVGNFIDELLNAGVDGICWYHAKYIGLPKGQTYVSESYTMPENNDYKEDEGSDFWTTVYSKMVKKETSDDGSYTEDRKLFSYVNLNLDPNFKGEKFVSNSNSIPSLSHDPNYFDEARKTIKDDGNYFRPLREYTKYNRVVDSWYGKSAAWQDGVTFAEGYWTTWQSRPRFFYGWTSNELSGLYAAEPTDMVYLAENEDTYLNNPEVMYEPMCSNNTNHENRTTNAAYATLNLKNDKVPTPDGIDRAYVEMAGHNGVTTVYFARPIASGSDFVLGSDFSDLDGTKPYCYFEDTYDATTHGYSTVCFHVFNNTEGKKFSTEWPGATLNVGYQGQHNGHNVYRWVGETGKDPEKVMVQATKTVKVSAKPEAPADGKIHFYAYTTSAPHIYICAGEKWKQLVGGWNDAPLMSKSSVDGWYEYSLETTEKDLHVILHNGNGLQTSNFDGVNGNIWMYFDQTYNINGLGNQPAATLNADNTFTPILKLTGGGNAYKQGEYYTSTGVVQKNPSPDLPVLPDTVKREGKNVVFVKITNPNAFPVKSRTDGTGWNVIVHKNIIDKPYLYSFNSETMGSWPGKPANGEVKDKDGNTWYYFLVATNTKNIIPNNGIPDDYPEKGAGKDTISTQYKRQTKNYENISFDRGGCFYCQWDGISPATSEATKADPDNKTVYYGMPDFVDNPSYNRFEGKTVAEANKLHNILKGEAEAKQAEYNHDNQDADIGIVARKDGAVIVMRNPANHSMRHIMTNPSSRLMPGKYTDLISDSTFTVDSTNIVGFIGDKGIAVLMKPNVQTIDYIVTPEAANASDGNVTVQIINNSSKTLQYRTRNSDMYSYYDWYGKGYYYNTDYNNIHYYSGNNKWTSIAPSTDNNAQAATVNLQYLKGGASKGSGAELEYGQKDDANIQDQTVWLDVKYEGQSDNEAQTYKYKLHNPNASTTYFHSVYFHFADGIIPDSLEISAWSNQGNVRIPLTRTGMRLARYHSDPKEYHRPIVGLYQMNAKKTTKTVLERHYNWRSRHWSYRYVTKDITESHDGPYLDALGVGDKYLTDHGWDGATFSNENGDEIFSSAELKAIDETPYDLEKGTYYNDVYPMCGMKFNRFTIGIPNISFPDVKFRLTYHNPLGFDQQLETVELLDGADGYFEVQNDPKTNNLSIAPMMFMAGDALFSNAYMNFTSQSSDKGCNFWVRNDKLDMASPSVLTYQAVESRDSSKTNRTTIYAYTGEFIHGKKLRVGSRFDFEYTFVKDAAAAKSNTDTYKIPLKKVRTSKMFSDLITGNYGTTTSMNRSVWNGSKVNELNSSGAIINSYSDLTWDYPSGVYTVKFYTRYGTKTQKDNDRNIIVNDTTYWLTVSHPTMTYTYATYDPAKYTGQYSGKNDPAFFKAKDDTVRNYPVALTGLEYDYVGDETEVSKSTNGSVVNNYYAGQSGTRIGRPGKRGAKIIINSNNGSKPYVYQLELRDSTNSNVTDDYASMYPETGNYKIVYRPQHNFKENANTSGAKDFSYTSKKSGGYDIPDAYHFLLGFSLVYYDKFYEGQYGIESKKPEVGYWGTYSDGLPRKKPEGVKAYYISGYAREVEKSNRNQVGFVGTEFTGDVLPANTGLLLFIPKDATDVPAVNFQKLANPSTGKYCTLWLEAVKEDAASITQPTGVNFMKPWIANDPNSNEFWSEPFIDRYPNANNYRLSSSGIIRDPETKEFKPFKGMFFWNLNPSRTFYKTSYQWREAVISIPKDYKQDDTTGDIEFGAKPYRAKQRMGDWEVVTTAPIDVYFGDGFEQVVTGIREITTDSDANHNRRNDGAYYNLSGQRVSNPHHGVFIKNGKKVIIK